MLSHKAMVRFLRALGIPLAANLGYLGLDDSSQLYYKVLRTCVQVG